MDELDFFRQLHGSSLRPRLPPLASTGTDAPQEPGSADVVGVAGVEVIAASECPGEDVDEDSVAIYM